MVRPSGRSWPLVVVAFMLAISAVLPIAVHAQSTPSASPITYPLTVTDCTGATATFDAPPTRVVTLTANILEFLLRLGLKDRVVGIQAAAPGALPEDLRDVADSLPKLGGEYVPGAFAPVQRETMLSASPDFVIGGWPSNFDASLGALTRDDLTERGINSYFAYAAACGASGPVTDLSVVYRDIENYGKIFDIQDTANALIKQMQDTVAAAQAKVGNAAQPKVFSYSWEDGRGDAYAVGNQNVANAIIGLAGGKNIFDDVDAIYGTVSWEDVVSRNPDVIVIEVFGKPTQEEFDKVVAEAEDFFTNDPALQNVTAVKNRTFVPVVAETYYVGGVRNADAVAALAQALHPDAFK